MASDWLSHTSSDANHVISADVDIAKPAADSDDDGCGDSDEKVIIMGQHECNVDVNTS